MSSKHFLPIAALALLTSASALRAQTAASTAAAAAAATQPVGTPNGAAAVRTAQQNAAAAQAANADAAAVVAAPAPAPAAPAPVAPEVVVKDAASFAKPVAKSKDATGHDTLSVDFPDTDVRDILRNVADLFELNLVIPDTLQGKTTIKLRDVTWRQIFQVVLSPIGFTYQEEGNIIKIVSNESLLQEPTTTEVFILSYAKAAEVQPTIAGLVDAAAGGKIVVDGRTNALIITERGSRFNRIRPILEALDRATDQVMIEAKFVEVTNSNISNIGVNWSSLANYKVGASGLSGAFSRTRGQAGTGGFNNSTGTGTTGSNGTTQVTTNGTTLVTTTGTTGVTSNGTTGATVNGTNTTGAVTSTNGATTATSSTGSNASITNGTTTSGTTGTNNASTAGVNNASTSGINNALTNTVTDTFTNLASLANTDATSRALNAVFSASEFSLVLSALQQESGVKIVSNPTIVTLNNTEATMNVGSQFPVPSYAFNQQTGTFEVSGFTFKDIGIELKVTPQVNAKGYITLKVSPTVSQQNGTTSFGGAGGATIPIVATRKAVTNVSLKDGYTMGIGGLLSTQTTSGTDKIPVMGNIPLLGRLFKHDTKNVQETNLIIFITAKSVSAEGAPVERLFDSDRVRQLDMRREDLPGYRDGSDPFKPSTPPAKAGKK